MATGFSRDRLQPSLLDRLIDDDRSRLAEAAEERLINKARLREFVLRDLSWLLNATAPWKPTDPLPALVTGSVLNYGMPPLSGRYASATEIEEIERSLARVIARYEPRLLSDTIRVRGVSSGDEVAHHNVMSFEISAELWADPYPLELLLKTELDIETGVVRVQDQGGDYVGTD